MICFDCCTSPHAGGVSHNFEGGSEMYRLEQG